MTDDAEANVADDVEAVLNVSLEIRGKTYVTGLRCRPDAEYIDQFLDLAMASAAHLIIEHCPAAKVGRFTRAIASCYPPPTTTEAWTEAREANEAEDSTRAHAVHCEERLDAMAQAALTLCDMLPVPATTATDDLYKAWSTLSALAHSWHEYVSDPRFDDQDAGGE